jgi:DNA-directed RNA polymerase sigma subunit (sigma70/sigma32)
MKLVTNEPGLDAFLDPKREFEAPVTPPLKRPEATPSRVTAAVNTLGKLESAVLAALFPPSGEPPATLEEISEELGMSIDEVKNIADEALRGLRGGCTSHQRVSKAWN